MYRMFFRIVEVGGKLNKNVLLPNAADALAQFQALLAVTERYSADSELCIAFKEGVLAWIGNSSFYPAIKEEPAVWLEVGIKMQNENAFKEAFIHCVGAMANLTASHVSGLDDQLRSVLEPKAQALRALRRKIELKLLYGMTLQKTVSRGSKKGQTYIASINNDYVSWIVVQLFSEWVKEHLQYLSDDEDDDDGPEKGQASKDKASIRTTATCDHKKTVKCLTVGGCFRLLGKGDDSYLPHDTVLKLVGALWEGGLDEEESKAALDALQELKSTAAKMVKPLVEKSELQYTGQEALEYLTCVEVGEEDIPWKMKGGHGDVDEDDEMEW